VRRRGPNSLETVRSFQKLHDKSTWILMKVSATTERKMVTCQPDQIYGPLLRVPAPACTAASRPQQPDQSTNQRLSITVARAAGRQRRLDRSIIAASRAATSSGATSIIKWSDCHLARQLRKKRRCARILRAGCHKQFPPAHPRKSPPYVGPSSTAPPARAAKTWLGIQQRCAHFGTQQPCWPLAATLRCAAVVLKIIVTRVLRRRQWRPCTAKHFGPAYGTVTTARVSRCANPKCAGNRLGTVPCPPPPVHPTRYHIRYPSGVTARPKAVISGLEF